VERALEKLDRKESPFGIDLAAAVKGNRIGPMLLDNLSEGFGSMAKGGGPIGLLKALPAIVPNHWPKQAVGGIDSFAEEDAFGANAPEIRRRIRHTANVQSMRRVPVDLQTAAHATIRANGLKIGHESR
jgi:hypothetical protein